MAPWYTATEQFNPEAKPAEWSAYVAGSGLLQLREVISLDILLCPPILRDIKAEYWPHIVNEDFGIDILEWTGRLKKRRPAAP